ncbi:MAG: ribonuclease H-like domain-containing protein [Desulfobulbaceae bacterium]|nr:ribonuclease H-like domain-containing protein [Desulfobulbaceae bacterium]
MLTNTFQLIQKIGPKSEDRLWQRGIRHWDDLTAPYPDHISPAQGDYMASCLAEARTHLPSRPGWFLEKLAAREHWRIFPHFQKVSAYLDIETDGSFANRITTATIFDGQRIRCFVHDENLDDLPLALREYDVLITYSGKSFDVPVIEKQFGTTFKFAHLDLRYLLAGLGFKGGLKKCEIRLGLDRGELTGVDGYAAVLLWQMYRRTGKRRALETLLAYNIMDTVNLERLMVEVYNRNIAATPFGEELHLTMPEPPPLPFTPDPELLGELRHRLAGGG